mmetsp:Transcript_24166/g.75895  ORF Transcript_24166/g.75895 Transcript_24166/m.75895 type:complete len:280 (+) Transcript_24166:120-959(+)
MTASTSARAQARLATGWRCSPMLAHHGIRLHQRLRPRTALRIPLLPKSPTAFAVAIALTSGTPCRRRRQRSEARCLRRLCQRALQKRVQASGSAVLPLPWGSRRRPAAGPSGTGRWAWATPGTRVAQVPSVQHGQVSRWGRRPTGRRRRRERRAASRRTSRRAAEPSSESTAASTGTLEDGTQMNEYTWARGPARRTTSRRLTSTPRSKRTSSGGSGRGASRVPPWALDMRPGPPSTSPASPTARPSSTASTTSARPWASAALARCVRGCTGRLAGSVR